MNKTDLYVLDWQVRNILRLKKEQKSADPERSKKIYWQINKLCQNMENMDPDKTKRLELMFSYLREHLRTSDAKKRVNILAHSLSNFLLSYDSEAQLDNHILYQLLEHKIVQHIIQNASPKKFLSYQQTKPIAALQIQRQ